jgi:hypothetical protein
MGNMRGMVFYRTFCAALFAALVFAGAASAQSLKDARAREATEKNFAREAKYTRSVCGAELDAEIDWASVGDWQKGLLVAECDRALGALEAACRSGDERAKSVRRFVCAGDGSGAELRGSTLRYGAARGVDAFDETQSVLGG